MPIIISPMHTDSTYIPGLAKVLKRMTESKILNTITPGKMYAAAHTESMLELRLTTSTLKTSGPVDERHESKKAVGKPIQEAQSGGSISQKLLARCESSVQEVVFATYLPPSYFDSDHVLIIFPRCFLYIRLDPSAKTIHRIWLSIYAKFWKRSSAK